jgi:hypothetical protein
MADLMHRYPLEVSPTKGVGRWEIIRLIALRPVMAVIEAAKLDSAFLPNGAMPG